MKSVGDILSYEGDVTDMVINYIMLCVVLVVPLMHILRDEGSRKIWWWWLGVFIFFWAFQIGLCLLVGCTGISIIWNSMYGHLVHDGVRKLFGGRILWYFILVTLAVIGADVYYAVTSDIITTVAHICALVLGIILSVSHWQWMKRHAKASPTDEETEETDGLQ